MTRPVYVDDNLLVIGTPSGRLLRINTAAGTCERIYGCASPITDLQVAAEDRLLLVGCEDGRLSLLPV